jgi:uncharacterized protein (DUF58 family)
MNTWWGWTLALAALVMGWVQWGWQGVLLALTVIVFWLLLQFSRAMRVMRQAAGAPVGHVDSAVMLHSRLRKGMRLLDIIPLTRSLGVAGPAGAETSESFTWTDASGACVRVDLTAGRLQHWMLERPPEAPDAAPVALASGETPDRGAGA